MWTQVSNMGPSPRTDASLAFHPGDQRVVLFGGLANGGILRDTWEWDGELWSMAQDIGPSERHDAPMTEASDGTVLLFGGRRGAAVIGDTWAWDGGTWTQVEDSGPPPRGGAAIATHPVSGRTMLFGGDGRTDTWTWDGTLWSQVQNSGPALVDPEMVWDVPSATMILVGSVGPARPWRTFMWAQEMWVPVSDMGPASSVRCAFSSPRGAIACDDDTWLWDGTRRRWTQVQDMGPKSGSLVGTWDPARSRGVGFDGTAAATWRLTAPA